MAWNVRYFLLCNTASASLLEQVLLDEDFNWLRGVGNLDDSIRTIINISINNPKQLNGDPELTLENTGDGNASFLSFNVRSGANPIDGQGDPNIIFGDNQ